jgi:hypothetical protein
MQFSPAVCHYIPLRLKKPFIVVQDDSKVPMHKHAVGGSRDLCHRDF